jgi:hypothetical protein
MDIEGRSFIGSEFECRASYQQGYLSTVKYCVFTLAMTRLHGARFAHASFLFKQEIPASVSTSGIHAVIATGRD